MSRIFRCIFLQSVHCKSAALEFEIELQMIIETRKHRKKRQEKSTVTEILTGWYTKPQEQKKVYQG